TAASVDWAAVARLVLASRRLDELEERELAPAGQIAYQFSAKGHELAQVLLALSLTHPHDAAAVYYRSRPFALAAGLTLAEAPGGRLRPPARPAGGARPGRRPLSPAPPRAYDPAHVRQCGRAVHPGRWLGAGRHLPARCSRRNDLARRRRRRPWRRRLNR